MHPVLASVCPIFSPFQAAGIATAAYPHTLELAKNGARGKSDFVSLLYGSEVLTVPPGFSAKQLGALVMWYCFGGYC